MRCCKGTRKKGQAIKEKKITFWNLFFYVPKFRRPLSSRVEGGLGLNGPALREELLFAASLSPYNFETFCLKGWN